MPILRLPLLLALVLGLLVPSTATAPTAAGSALAAERPNVVLVLMDDFSLELLSTMREGQRMRRAGAEFTNAYVVDSLCCPSRAATLSGLPPHLNGVRANTGAPDGGYLAFRDNGNLQHTVNVSLDDAGYRTGFVGKYMNRYEPDTFGGRLPLVPGWDDFEAVSPGGYAGWNFQRSTRVGDRLVLHKVRRPSVHASRARKDKAYATNVIADRTMKLLRGYERAEQPYFLYVAPYGPHSRVTRPAYRGDPWFPAAFRDRPRPGHPHGNCGARDCQSITTRDLPGFGESSDDNRPTVVRASGRVATAPSWRRAGDWMTPRMAESFLRDRARMVQSIDRMLTRIRRAVGQDTYVILTSDNGFHLGQHGLRGGKGTPYRSDVQVPLLITGPGVDPGRRTLFTTNVDLAPTIEELAGAAASGPRAGTSLVPALRGNDGGPAYAFVEHAHTPVRAGEPDADYGTGARLDEIPSYVAVRSERGLLVRLRLPTSWRGASHAWELYDYRHRSWEKTNVYREHRNDPWVRDLAERLKAWVDCTPDECRRLTRA